MRKRFLPQEAKQPGGVSNFLHLPISQAQDNEFQDAHYQNGEENMWRESSQRRQWLAGPFRGDTR
jgi:hypothetical protein